MTSPSLLTLILLTLPHSPYKLRLCCDSDTSANVSFLCVCAETNLWTWCKLLCLSNWVIAKQINAMSYRQLGRLPHQWFEMVNRMINCLLHTIAKHQSKKLLLYRMTWPLCSCVSIVRFIYFVIEIVDGVFSNEVLVSLSVVMTL